ncbi:MAG TPA: lamin tail domain-containing protein [Candidatus Paceibacterota bacterium]
MLYINEWLPNPIGNDAVGEFIELYNGGATPADLNGYALGDGTKKKFSLTGYSIPPGGYLVLNHAQDKLTLKNTGGALWLYGPHGRVVDSASFSGAAPEGKSFSRVDYSAAPIAHFAFEYPTPGTANKTIDTTVSVNDYPLGVPLASSQLSSAAFIVLTAGVASFFLLFFIYVIRQNRNISNLFFGRDEEAGI